MNNGWNNSQGAFLDFLLILFTIYWPYINVVFLMSSWFQFDIQLFLDDFFQFGPILKPLMLYTVQKHISPLLFFSSLCSTAEWKRAVL